MERFPKRLWFVWLSIFPLLACSTSSDIKSPPPTSASLHEAVASENLELLHQLLEMGAPINSVDKNGDTALHLATNWQVAELLLSKGASLGAKNKRLETPLHKAAMDKNGALVSGLLKSGAYPEPRNFYGWTPLALSVVHDNQEGLEALLAGGVNINTISNENKTPLEIAISSQKNDLVKILLKNGAQPKPGILHLAAKEGNLKWGETILTRKDVDINLKNDLEDTALHVAASEGHKTFVELLIERGADVKLMDRDQRTPAELAAEKGHVEISKLLQGQTLVQDDAVVATGPVAYLEHLKNCKPFTQKFRMAMYAPENIEHNISGMESNKCAVIITYKSGAKEKCLFSQEQIKGITGKTSYELIRMGRSPRSAGPAGQYFEQACSILTRAKYASPMPMAKPSEPASKSEPPNMESPEIKEMMKAGEKIKKSLTEVYEACVLFWEATSAREECSLEIASRPEYGFTPDPDVETKISGNMQTFMGQGKHKNPYMEFMINNQGSIN